ncbi:MAG: hypothetical protein JNK47_03955 [Mesorhizobium sp.]|nr:GcrA family cell cycle regulator [Mesorhizobium sp.]MBL8576356.1 hypothetical protein [Mesorhizobium sp.]
MDEQVLDNLQVMSLLNVTNNVLVLARVEKVSPPYERVPLYGRRGGRTVVYPRLELIEWLRTTSKVTDNPVYPVVRLSREEAAAQNLLAAQKRTERAARKAERLQAEAKRKQEQEAWKARQLQVDAQLNQYRASQRAASAAEKLRRESVKAEHKLAREIHRAEMREQRERAAAEEKREIAEDRQFVNEHAQRRASARKAKFQKQIEARDDNKAQAEAVARDAKRNTPDLAAIADALDKAPAPPKPTEQAEHQQEHRMLCLPLEQLTRSQCHWPVGDPRDDDFSYCGAATREGSRYCAHHAAIAFRKPDPLKIGVRK